MNAILFILLFTVQSIVSTKLAFVTKLRCSLGIRWCAKISYWELDDITDNDFYGASDIICTMSDEQFDVFFAEDQSDMWLDNYIEPFIRIFHNCTEGAKQKDKQGGVRLVREYYASVSLNDKDKRLERVLNLDGRGVNVTGFDV